VQIAVSTGGPSGGTTTTVVTTTVAATTTAPAPAGAGKAAVPKLVGVKAAAAVAQAQSAGFKPKVVSVASGQPSGVVVSQAPGAGTQAAKGSVVTLNVSKGPAAAPVPDVVGQQASDAGSIL